MRCLVLSALLALAGPAAAHELWLAPLDHVVPPDGMLQAEIVNGEEFEGPRMAYLPGRVARYEVAMAGEVVQVEMRMGDLPALNVPPPAADGLAVVGYQSTPSTVTWSEWERFTRFAEHKDLGEVEVRHRERGLPEDGFAEAYVRFSKTLIAVGSGAGMDPGFGFETEIVALANPYTDALPEGLPVRLTYRGDPRAEAQIEMFVRAADGGVTISTLRTDAEGVALVPLIPGTEVMLDAVVLREPSADLAATGAVWETLWANLTFAVPG